MAEQRIYRATVAYDGTEYSGFQVQPGRSTIQGELESVLCRLTQEGLRVNGAGRTDAGVHAVGQVVSFRSAWRHSAKDLHRGMNALLPEDIAVRDLSVANEGFHARFSAKSRAYVYKIYESKVRDPVTGRYAHRVACPLDMGRMEAAAEVLVGERDFAAFGQPTCGSQTTRRVFSARWGEDRVGGSLESITERDRRYHFEIVATGFLRGMVRRLVGTLLEVGAGRQSPREFAEILASREISAAAPPAPACGLFLWRVSYK